MLCLAHKQEAIAVGAVTWILGSTVKDSLALSEMTTTTGIYQYVGFCFRFFMRFLTLEVACIFLFATAKSASWLIEWYMPKSAQNRNQRAITQVSFERTMSCTPRQ
jgi:hypothetical protein